jgi:hypothetical protein
MTPAARGLLLRLQQQALHYFLDNQAPSGLILDRQANHGRRRTYGPCSLAASGMGCVALALASAPPHRLLSHSEACQRVGKLLDAALALPHTHGVLPHFVHSATGAVLGSDARSTVETAWLVAGALWAAEFLRDPAVARRAEELATRVDWTYWTCVDESDTCGLIRHGHDRHGRWLPCCWDRLNGETVFMYLLAAGTGTGRAWPADGWTRLQSFDGEAAGRRFGSADLGLFVFQYGYDLLDATAWRPPCGRDLWAEAATATIANRDACRHLAARFTTFRRYWGLSAGDGPGGYEAYAPPGPIDGTAHPTATLPAAAHDLGAVLENVGHALLDPLRPAGRYGISSLNLDHHWVGRDMVGIDAGAAVIGLDNCLADDRVRRTFHHLPAVLLGLERTKFAHRAAPPTEKRAS